MPTPTRARKLLSDLLFALLLAAALGWPVLVHADGPGKAVMDLNTATAAELESLPGIGPAKVKLIMAYRAQHRFRTVEELVRVKGLGPKSVRVLRPLLTIGGIGSTPPAQAARPATAAAAAPEKITPRPAKPVIPCSCPCRCAAAP